MLQLFTTKCLTFEIFHGSDDANSCFNASDVGVAGPGAVPAGARDGVPMASTLPGLGWKMIAGKANMLWGWFGVFFVGFGFGLFGFFFVWFFFLAFFFIIIIIFNIT